MSATCLAYIQTIASIVQAIVALIVVVTFILQRRDAMIDRLIQAMADKPTMPTPDERAGTPYSQRRIDFVDERMRKTAASGGGGNGGADKR
jgi:hypothetical protein